MAAGEPAHLSNRPSVYLACPHCYTNGELVGDWRPLTTAPDVIPVACTTRTWRPRPMVRGDGNFGS